MTECLKDYHISEMLNVHFLSKVIDVHHVPIFDEYWFAEKTDLTKSEKKVMVTVLQIICQKISDTVTCQEKS
jgi:hypothetical protein